MGLDTVHKRPTAERPKRGWFERNRSAVIRRLIINFFVLVILYALACVLMFSFNTLGDELGGEWLTGRWV